MQNPLNIFNAYLVKLLLLSLEEEDSPHLARNSHMWGPMATINPRTVVICAISRLWCFARQL